MPKSFLINKHLLPRRDCICGSHLETDPTFPLIHEKKKHQKIFSVNTHKQHVLFLISVQKIVLTVRHHPNVCGHKAAAAAKIIMTLMTLLWNPGIISINWLKSFVCHYFGPERKTTIFLRLD